MDNLDSTKRERLFSLDVLRGLDMILLVVVGPLVLRIDKAWHLFSPEFVGQFRHNWLGFTLWDIIMPLFIFMCGAAIPFALGRRLKEGKRGFWKHVLGRVALLWFLGMLVQGDLTALNPMTFTPYSNTLQAIAMGYLLTAAVMCVPSRTFSIAVPVAMVAVYSVLLEIGGDYSEFGNFAIKVDRSIHEFIFPAGHVRLVHRSHYTWFLTSLMFGAMTLCGYHATEILRTSWRKRTKALALFAYAGALLAIGLVLSLRIPVVKPIFTVSFTSLAMGWCVVSLAVLYVVNDILMIRRSLGVVLLFGQCALAAYFVSHYFHPVLNAFADTVAAGFLSRLSVESRPVIREVVVVMTVVLFLRVWRRRHY